MFGVNIYDIRRANLERALERAGGTLADFATKTAVSPIYLTQVLSDRTQRHMGDKVARRIESKLELPAGWFDQINAPISSLSDQAVSIAAKLDQLPQSIRERIAAEVDVLHRYHSGT